ncbi:HAD family hydrolase [uncultured Pseudokineococcus sp.]|uniref:HAD family hydrolase n=1 Tax=uncultured Pseudokineococcus sp. TaxID=1642928 RepID=UPI0026144FFB|nr:HAD hydrolase-like protein [uncultured Pseudokineococcus sp.]
MRAATPEPSAGRRRGEGPVVGFDLDQTLVDSGPRISACLRAALGEVGLPFDEAAAEAARGLPLAGTLAALVPPGRATPALLEDLAARYRAQDRRPDGEGGHPLVGPMPHARAALEAVVAGGGRAVVVSAKRGEAVGRVLARAGLDDLVDAVAGDRFGVAKAGALLEQGAVVYVGDHPADVDAARAAGAAAVAVATGAHGPAALEALGADVVLPDLEAFPAWLEPWAARRRSA